MPNNVLLFHAATSLIGKGNDANILPSVLSNIIKRLTTYNQISSGVSFATFQLATAKFSNMH